MIQTHLYNVIIYKCRSETLKPFWWIAIHFFFFVLLDLLLYMMYRPKHLIIIQLARPTTCYYKNLRKREMRKKNLKKKELLFANMNKNVLMMPLFN